MEFRKTNWDDINAVLKAAKEVVWQYKCCDFTECIEVDDLLESLRSLQDAFSRMEQNDW